MAANDRERDRLVTLLSRLSDSDLARLLGNGLSVADVLVHLAFWDEYACSVLQRWQQEGFSTSHTHFEAINAAILVLAATIPDSEAPRLAREAAERVDREARSVPSELADVIVENGKLRTLERAQHRAEHLDQIEDLLEPR